MKKISFVGVCLVSASMAFAQADRVKDAEHMVKGYTPDYAGALTVIKPALENPETAKNVNAWYIAGKASAGVFEDAYKKIQLQQELTNEQKNAAGKALGEAYKYYLAALPLDSIPDAKGKIKPKKSKDIIKEMVNNYNFLSTAGNLCWETNDGQGAYDVWELYLTLPNNPVLAGKLPQIDLAMAGNMMFIQGIAMLNTKDYQKAMEKFLQASKTPYENENIYVGGIQAAMQIGNNDAVIEFAQKGYDIYGAKNTLFISELINDRIQKKDYAGAHQYVTVALDSVSDASIKAQLLDVLGVVYETEEKYDDALKAFNEAAALDASNAKIFFDLGRILNNQAARIDEKSEDPSKIDPAAMEGYVKAAEAFDRAYQLDENRFSQVPGILYRLYYRLGKGYEDKASYWEKLQ
ncbi:MAG: hypothetical protein K2O88_02530 [Paramuribaculum sp.]|nr:hypothetical protein [Paramuribaculum sp.]